MPTSPHSATRQGYVTAGSSHDDPEVTELQQVLVSLSHMTEQQVRSSTPSTAVLQVASAEQTATQKQTVHSCELCGCSCKPVHLPHENLAHWKDSAPALSDKAQESSLLTLTVKGSHRRRSRGRGRGRNLGYKCKIWRPSAGVDWRRRRCRYLFHVSTTEGGIQKGC